MPSSIVRNPVRPGDDFKARQKLEFDRLRTAIAIVERMRQAGICCELYSDVKTIVHSPWRSFIPRWRWLKPSFFSRF